MMESSLESFTEASIHQTATSISAILPHLNQDAGLRVAPTSLPNCDFLGLFATKYFAKDSILCVYTGTVLRTKEALRLNDKSYLMRLGEQCYVDAREDLSILARYINDSINPLWWNVVFDKRPEDKCAYVRAIKDIFPGEEIFVDYGKWYWLKKAPVRFVTPKSTLEAVSQIVEEDSAEILPTE